MCLGAASELSLDSAALRAAHYNAAVTHLRRVHDELLVLRVHRDAEPLSYVAGQYTVLGLGYWEPRVDGVQEESLAPRQLLQVVKRAYSISSPILDSAGRLLPSADGDEVEFYISLVRRAEAHPPALSPRLFALSLGDRLFVGPHAHGNYTLRGVEAESAVVFAATGTGEAPHNAMVAELLARGHRGRIVSVCCVRRQQDLAYLATHRRLEQMFPNYRYVGLTTREPCNIDSTRPDYVGKFYLQDYFVSGRFEKQCQMPLDPQRTHVYLCGNPAMIGLPDHHCGRRFPQPAGMVEILERQGFRLDEPHRPGSIHVEKYW